MDIKRLKWSVTRTYALRVILENFTLQELALIFSLNRYVYHNTMIMLIPSVKLFSKKAYCIPLGWSRELYTRRIGVRQSARSY